MKAVALLGCSVLLVGMGACGAGRAGADAARWLEASDELSRTYASTATCVDMSNALKAADPILFRAPNSELDEAFEDFYDYAIGYYAACPAKTVAVAAGAVLPQADLPSCCGAAGFGARFGGGTIFAPNPEYERLYQGLVERATRVNRLVEELRASMTPS